jgi:type I restriction enzyme R subunit
MYNDLYLAIRTIAQTENIDSDVVFEMELIKQVDINIDYILMLAAKYHASNCMNKTILVDIERAVKSSIELRSKKELIDTFLSRVNSSSHVHEDWQTFINKQKEIELTNLIKKENLNEEKTKKYFESAFRDGELKLYGTEINDLMPPVSRFGNGNREEKKREIVEKFKEIFEKYKN